MRWSLALLLPLLLAGASWAHEWTDDYVLAPEWDTAHTDSYLGCSGGQMLGYGEANTWADEVQVCFQLPEPPEGGPWLIEYVAFFLSGNGTHYVTIRQANSRDSAPGSVLADDLTFTPVYSEWPPAEWTYVPLEGSVAYPHNLPGSEGECISLGFEMMPGDAIGLAGTEMGTRGWSNYQGSWIDDATVNGMTAAVRLGLTDLGVSEANQSTWGEIKDLFKNR